MIERRLKLLIVTYLWVALVEVAILSVMAWIVWLFHILPRLVLKLLFCAVRLLSRTRARHHALALANRPFRLT
jgi:hypothetical protein